MDLNLLLRVKSRSNGRRVGRNIRQAFETIWLMSFSNVEGVATITIDLESKKRGKRKRANYVEEKWFLYMPQFYRDGRQAHRGYTTSPTAFQSSAPMPFQGTQSFNQFKYRALSKVGQARESHSLDAVLCSGKMRWSFSSNGYAVILRRKRERDLSVQHSLCSRMCHDLLKCLFHNDQEMSGRYEK